MITHSRSAPTQNAHSMSERIEELILRTQGRYDLRPVPHVEYKEDPSDDITSTDYPCESAVEGIDRKSSKMSCTSDSTSDSEWSTDDDESGYGGSSFVSSSSDESVDSNGSYAPSHLTGDCSTSNGCSEISFDSPHSSFVAGSDSQASVLREDFSIAGTQQRKSSTDRNNCSGFSLVSHDDGYDVSDNSSDDGFCIISRNKPQTPGERDAATNRSQGLRVY